MGSDITNLVVCLAVSFIFASFFIPIALSYMSDTLESSNIVVRFLFPSILVVVFLFGIVIAFLPRNRGK